MNGAEFMECPLISVRSRPIPKSQFTFYISAGENVVNIDFRVQKIKIASKKILALFHVFGLRFIRDAVTFFYYDENRGTERVAI